MNDFLPSNNNSNKTNDALPTETSRAHAQDDSNKLQETTTCDDGKPNIKVNEEHFDANSSSQNVRKLSKLSCILWKHTQSAKSPKKQSKGARFLLIQHSKFSVIHSYRLLFRRFSPL